MWRVIFERQIAPAQLFLNVGEHAGHGINAIRERICLLKKCPIDIGKKPRGVIGGAPQHDAIKTSHFISGLLKCGQPAIQDDVEMREVCLQLMNAGIVERWNFPVFLWAEALQPGFAGMDYESITTRCGNSFNKAIKSLGLVLVVDADAAFHRHRNFDGQTHRRNTVGHKLRFGHEAGAKSSLLNPVGGAANVEIDFAIAIILANLGSIRKQNGIAAAELEGHGLLKGIKAQQALAVAMANGLGRHHLGVEQRVPGQVAVKDTAMPVRPIHHAAPQQNLCAENCVFAVIKPIFLGSLHT